MLKEAPFNRDKKDLSENFFVLTTDCNFNCPYCIAEEIHKKNFISDEDFKKGLDFSKGQGLTTIHLQGGEPTLHPHIVKYAKWAKSYGFAVNMTTNFIDAKKVKELDGILDTITISYGKQPFLPNPKEWKSHLILYTVIEKSLIPTLDDLKKFIKEKKEAGFTVLFTTLNPINQYAYDNQYVDYLEELFLQTPMNEMRFSTNKVGFMVDDCYVRMGNKKYRITDKYNVRANGEIYETFHNEPRRAKVTKNPELEKKLEAGNKKLDLIKAMVCENGNKTIATLDYKNKTIPELAISTELPKSILNVGQIIPQQDYEDINTKPI